MIPTVPTLGETVETALMSLGFQEHKNGADPSQPSVFTYTSNYGTVGKSSKVGIHTRCSENPTSQAGNGTWDITHTLMTESGILVPPSLPKSMSISYREPDVPGSVMQQTLGIQDWEKALKSQAALDLFGRGNAVATAMSKMNARKTPPAGPEKMNQMVSARLQTDTEIQKRFVDMSKDVEIQWDPLPLPEQGMSETPSVRVKPNVDSLPRYSIRERWYRWRKPRQLSHGGKSARRTCKD
jgi:hypothetical protein